MTDKIRDFETNKPIDLERQPRVSTDALAKFERQMQELEELGEAPTSAYRISHPFDTRINSRAEGELGVTRRSDFNQS